MPMPVSFIPAPPRRLRQDQRRAATSPSTTLTLIAARYVPGTSVTLTFDRAIVIDDFDPSTVFVADHVNANESYVGQSASLAGASGVRVMLTEYEGGVAAGVHLTVTSDNRIEDATTGAAWAGVDLLALPFG